MSGSSNYLVAMSDTVRKAVDSTTAKNRRKMSIKDLNFQIKKFMDWFEIGLQNQLHNA